MYKNRNITSHTTLLDALKKMDDIDKKLLLIIEDHQFQGLVSVGDIQRAIIENKSLDTPVKAVVRKNIKIAKPEDDMEKIKNMMVEYRMEFCPVVDENDQIQKIYFWEDIFKSEKPQPKQKFNLPVVIMAGGKGTRMRPITYIIPKPLLPINEKTILEILFEKFNEYGCQDFYLTVNYKSEILKYYIKELNLPFNVHFIEEKKALGTAGSLKLMENELTETFFVNNCDIIIDADYSEILKYHKDNKNDITLIATMKTYPIPYGTLETGENGELLSITEKPELTFKINSGMYVLEPHVLKSIPKDSFYHITELIDKIKRNNGMVGVFPVSEKSWVDIGNWVEYNKILDEK